MLGMPRTENEFEFDMVFCFVICLALYAVFLTRIYLQHIAQPVESDCPLNIMFVCLSVCQFMNVDHNSTTAWDRFMQF